MKCSSLLGASAVWMWSYYPTELGWLNGSRRLVVRVILSDGLLDAHVFIMNTPRQWGGKSTFEVKPFVENNYPWPVRPAVASFETFKRTGWGDYNTRVIHFEVVWGFVFVIFGVVPFSFLVLLPFLKAWQRRSTKPECGPPTPSSTRSGQIPPD